MAFHPEDLVSLYAVTAGGIYLSEDRARTWEPVFRPQGLLWSSAQLRFDPHNPHHLYLVTSRALYESGDAGRTWGDVGQQFEGYPWFNDLAFDPFDPSAVYVTTTWGVYRLDRTPAVTAVEETVVVPVAFSLQPNYPNPFNPSTTIRFSLPQAGEVELSVYNLMGQRVATLVYGVQEAGAHLLQWDGWDEQGRELASGVYFYRLQVGGRVETRKLLLLR
ncbi:MAG: T9SS type A sorting domain-containing protein [Candidatus Latescibacteria bacterium]|nr:T9SS type A sorting domain-containing protein [Candidatus Latescibacterota bacterium]